MILKLQKIEKLINLNFEKIKSSSDIKPEIEVDEKDTIDETERNQMNL